MLKAARHAAPMAVPASHAIKNKSVQPDRASTNNAMVMSAIRHRFRMRRWFVKMTIPIADRTALTAIHLQPVRLQGRAILMEIVRSRRVKKGITSITTHVKPTVQQTAAHMAINAMSRTL